MMTSTPFNVGLTDNTRSSSRVLRPPGGGHTDIFGGEPEPTRGRRLVPSANGQGDQIVLGTNGAAAPVQNGQETKESPQPQEAPPVPQAKSDNPKVVTPTESKSEPPKRVRVPPGGFSSGLW